MQTLLWNTPLRNSRRTPMIVLRPGRTRTSI